MSRSYPWLLHGRHHTRVLVLKGSVEVVVEVMAQEAVGMEVAAAAPLQQVPAGPSKAPDDGNETAV